MVHAIKKFCSTLRICGCLIMARTFGRYVHSGYDGYDEYAEYEWRGQTRRIPMFSKLRTVSEDELLAALRRDYQ